MSLKENLPMLQKSFGRPEMKQRKKKIKEIENKKAFCLEKFL
jgi:hypothetical protein